MTDTLDVNLIVNAIAKGFDNVTKEMRGASEAVSDKAPEAASLRWTELASKVSLARTAFDLVAGAAKKGYEELKAGAQLELARSQFDNLAESIDTTSDALLNKLGDATSGMMSNAEMIASASQIISLGLADNEDQVVRLATSVSTLGLDMQQVIMTFANNSKMRLDALGLSVERVDELTKELEANGFKGDAFDEAVLIALEEKMTLLGDASETTAGKLKRFEADVQNLKDAGRLMLVDFLTPTIDALGTLADIGKNGGDVIANITDEAIKGAASTEDLVEQYKKTSEQLGMWGGAAARLTGTSDDLRQAQNDLRKAIASSTDSAEDYIDAMDELGLAQTATGVSNEEFLRQEWEKANVMDFNSRMVAGYNARLEDYKMRTQEATAATYEAESADRALTSSLEYHTSVLGNVTTGIDMYSAEAAEATTLTEQLRAQIEALEGQYRAEFRFEAFGMSELERAYYLLGLIENIRQGGSTDYVPPTADPNDIYDGMDDYGGNEMDNGGIPTPTTPAPPSPVGPPSNNNTPMVNNFYNTQASPRQIASAIGAYVPRG